MEKPPNERDLFTILAKETAIAGAASLSRRLDISSKPVALSTGILLKNLTTNSTEIGWKTKSDITGSRN